MGKPLGVAAVVLLSVPAAALSPKSARVHDLSGLSRATYATNEHVALTQTVFIVDASTERVKCVFEVYGPGGQLVFTHSGNSAPGGAGNVECTVSGIPVKQLDRGSGAYKLKAKAQRGAETVEQEVAFAIFDPNITLTYPSNGATSLIPPIILRWASSGASKYRVTVGDNPSFYNSVFQQEVSGTEGQLAYPENPPDTRARLVAGTVYYWRVEGLDASGNVAAQAPQAFSFSIQATAATVTRDVAISKLDILEMPTGFLSDIPFVVTLTNQGGTTENNLTVKLELGGNQAIGSPATVASLGAGQSQELNFSAILPPDQPNAVAVACHTLFDDAPLNNCQTLKVAQIVRDLSQASGEYAEALKAKRSAPDEAWNSVKGLISDSAILEELKGYHVYEVEGIGISRDEVDLLLDAIKKGDAKVTGVAFE